METLDKHQVAERLRVSVRQVNVLVDGGVLPQGKKQGKKLLWLSIVIDRYLNEFFKEQLEFEMKSTSPARKGKFVQNFD